MAASVEDFEDLYQDAPCGYLSMDGDGRILTANATLATWTGYPAQELVGRRFRDLLTIGTRILYETSYAPLLSAQGFVEEVSLDLRTAEGAVLAVLAGGKSRTDGSGRPASTRLAFLKASDRRRYERQLLEARDRSLETERAMQSILQTEREASKLREQFIAVLGHDLRNPLTSISSGARLLGKDQPPDKRRQFLEIIQGSVVRMSDLIDNVMDFARGRLGAGIPLELLADVSLPPVLEQVVTELRIAAPDRLIETDFHLPKPVRCDPSRIGQMVSNLLGNALTHGSPDEPVRIHADSEGQALTIWVANGGAPISEAALQRLFEPFFRGEVRPSQQGLGLGLHIASEIAKAHGGTLAVASTPEETRFTFRMPTDDR